MTTNEDRQLLQAINDRTLRMDAALFGANDGDEGFVQLSRKRFESHSNRLLRLEIAVGAASAVIGFLGWLVREHFITIQHLAGK